MSRVIPFTLDRQRYVQRYAIAERTALNIFTPTIIKPAPGMLFKLSVVADIRELKIYDSRTLDGYAEMLPAFTAYGLRQGALIDLNRGFNHGILICPTGGVLAVSFT